MITIAEQLRDDLKIPPSLALEIENFHWACLKDGRTLADFYKAFDGIQGSIKKHDAIAFIEMNRLAMEKEAQESKP